jgi:hypothetical protein
LINRHEVSWIASFGLGGQRLFIVPASELVCVVTAGQYDNAAMEWLPLLIFNRYACWPSPEIGIARNRKSATSESGPTFV